MANTIELPPKTFAEQADELEALTEVHRELLLQHCPELRQRILATCSHVRQLTARRFLTEAN